MTTERVSEERLDSFQEKLLRYSAEYRAFLTEEHTTGTLMALEARQVISDLRQSLRSRSGGVKVRLPDNLLSHRETWLKALERLIELEPESAEPDMDEKAYWRHEHQAMHDMYAALAVPLPEQKD